MSKLVVRFKIVFFGENTYAETLQNRWGPNLSGWSPRYESEFYPAFTWRSMYTYIVYIDTSIDSVLFRVKGPSIQMLRF